MTTKKRSQEVKVVVSQPRKVLGVTANVKNVLMAVALLIAFLGSFFSIYNWLDSTYTRSKLFQKLEARFDCKFESDVLNSMYSRLWTLDNMITLAPDASKIPVETRTEFNDLRAKIKLQEEKVKVLQEKMITR